MHPIPVLRRPLQELEKAIDDDDKPAALRAGARLMELAGGLWNHRPPLDDKGQFKSEDGRGDRQQDCARCLAKLGTMSASSAAAGPPWDGSLLRMLLEFLMQLLGPILIPHS